MEATMARKPSSRRTAGEATGSSQAAGEPRIDKRQSAVEALMSLSAERDWSDIELRDIAEKAGLSLVELRQLYPSKGAILAAFSRSIDEIVLGAIDPDMETEPARERLFDVLMRRIDALQPYKPAIENISRHFTRDPLSAAAWNRVAVNTMQWMLAAANVHSVGPLGALRAQGLAIAWSRIIRTWLDDDDEGLARTMTEIDRQLRSGERWLERVGDLIRLTRPFRHIAESAVHRRSDRRRRRRTRYEDEEEGPGLRRRRSRPDDAEAV
jgi:AcrR family transcriptional regulator